MRLSALRSLLFLPATSEHLLARAAQRGADALVVDLEDAVPPARKQEARGLATLAVAALAGQAPLLLRVNAEPALLAQDIAAAPLAHIAAVMLPKVESAQQVQALAAMLAQSGHAVPVVALIETALGVVQAASIAQAHPRLAALGFGGEDYAAEMGVAPLPRSLRWPAQQVATCARAWQLPCWGLPGSVAEIADMAAFAELVAEARAIGFTGTVCVHPRQVGVANAGFGATADELAWARRVLAADADAAARGLGAVVLDGRMVDRPIVERARRWLLQSERAGC
ncbi:MAG TPA: CoA ester lyase [Pseudorhodoferax sp.]|nr:CoA ester lyase [Pseudorhodoferax sp.]